MTDIDWKYYPLVACDQPARTWLIMQANLQLRPKTLDAYGRSLNDYLGFCTKIQTRPEIITREQFTCYVQDLATRPNPKGAKILSMKSGRGLSNSTLQQRITVARLYHDSLVEQGLRTDTPLRRGFYVAGKGFGGTRQRGEIPSYRSLPWIPSDEEWRDLLHALKEEPLRNQVMMLIAYDGALRREELVRLDIGDFDFAHRQIRVSQEHAKNRSARVVAYGKRVTSPLLQSYLQRRKQLSPRPGALFLSESHRNFAQPLSLIMWSKIVQRIAERTGLPRFTTHTPRHLRLTHLARAGLDLHQIATYAGHQAISVYYQVTVGL